MCCVVLYGLWRGVNSLVSHMFVLFGLWRGVNSPISHTFVLYILWRGVDSLVSHMFVLYGLWRGVDSLVSHMCVCVLYGLCSCYGLGAEQSSFTHVAIRPKIPQGLSTL